MSFSGKGIVSLMIAGVLLGCSTQKNTPVSRAYHNFVSHYNIYFNARESVKSGLKRIDNTIQDDYTHILPVFKTSDPDAGKAATAEMDLATVKCSKLITLHSITRSPRRKSNRSEHYKKFASKEEYNHWVDESYLLMGKAFYYKHDYHSAEENFNYLLNKFPDNANRYPAWLGLAKTYTETGENEKALEFFSLLDRDARFPKKLKKDLQIAQANYYLKNKDYPQAISHLELALQFHFPKKQSLRYHYILAQLYSAIDKPLEAVKEYNTVIKRKPPYQMNFNARISALELSGENDKKTGDQIEKLLNDQNNAEFLDRIYYARGQIALRENRKSDALNDFRLSVQKSTSNNYQRALSSLSAARILFGENNYLLSSCYYDSAMAVIDHNYPGYQEISARAESLRQLAQNLNTITREDSLQKLALLPEGKRNEAINKIISDVQAAELQKKNAESMASSPDQNYFRAQQYRPQIRVDDSRNLWYFYNPTTVGIGKAEFQRIWGKRKLEDNWRRKNKASVSSDDIEQLSDELKDTKSPQEKKKVADPKSREYYLQDLPISDSLRKISDEKIKAAFFNAGKIYQVDFNDYPKSISSFEELNKRFPRSSYELPSWFELFQLNQQLENAQQAAFYKNMILRNYPSTEFARFLQDPRYFEDLALRKTEIEKKYAEALKAYQNGDYANAKNSAAQTLALNPDTIVISKAKFIETVSEGTTQDKTVFAAALDQYIHQFPKSTTRELAIEIRNLLKSNALADYQQLLAKGYIKESAPGEALKSTAGQDEFQGKYSYDEGLIHYFVLAFSRDVAIDVNRLIYDIANYNLDYYTSTDFDIEKVNLNPRTQLIVVRGFPDKAEGLIYFRSIIRKRQVYQSLKNIEYVNFIASSTNYRKVIEEMDYSDYLRFFLKNYSPYYNSRVPTDELPTPAELKAQVIKAEEQPEKGKFVVVETPKAASVFEGYQGPYKTEVSGKNLFVLVFQTADADPALMASYFKAVSQENTGGAKLSSAIEPLDEFRSMVKVTGFEDLSSARAWYNQLNKNGVLPMPLKDISYRQFIITPENLEILKKEKNLAPYLEFFGKFNK